MQSKIRLAITSLLISLSVFFVPLAKAAPGDLDPTFGTGGIAIDITFTSSVKIRKVLLQPDGKIIVVGSKKIPLIIGQDPLDYLFVRRYTSTGAIDTTYPTSMRGVGADAEVQADGKLVVLGRAPNTVSSIFGSVDTSSPVVWRFNANGTIDTGFGSNGSTFLNSTEFGNYHIEVFAGNTFIAYASRSPFFISTPSYRVAKLSPSGTIDFTITPPFTYNADEKAFSMKVDPSNGDIVVGGTSNVDQNTVLRRYTQNGAVVSAFGLNGAAPVPDCSRPEPSELLIKDLIIQPDGKILVHRITGPSSWGHINISRQTSNGVADGLCTWAFGPPYLGPDLFLQPDGKYFYFLGVFSAAVRYFPDGTQDVNFVHLALNPAVIQPDQKWVRATTGDGAITLERRLLD